MAVAGGNLLAALSLPEFFELSFEMKGPARDMETPNILSLVDPMNLESELLALDTTSSLEMWFRYGNEERSAPPPPGDYEVEWTSVQIQVTPQEVAIWVISDGGASIQTESYLAATMGTIGTPRTVLLYASTPFRVSAGVLIRNLQVTGASPRLQFGSHLFSVDTCLPNCLVISLQG